MRTTDDPDATKRPCPVCATCPVCGGRHLVDRSVEHAIFERKTRDPDADVRRAYVDFQLSEGVERQVALDAWGMLSPAKKQSWRRAFRAALRR